MKALLTAGSAAFALISVSLAANAGTPTLDASIQSTIDHYRSKYSMPGVALSVKMPGETTLRDYFSGTTAKNATTAIDKNSLFQIGGVTKSFTAAIVLQLEAEGKINLDDTLGKWLPKYTAWKDLTLRQLLNETSGVTDYFAIPGFVSDLANDPSHSNLTLENLAGMAYDQHPNTSFKAGQKWEPSSTNYALLGLVIQAATGHSITDEMNQRLLGNRFGLSNSYYFPYPQKALDQLVHGYEADGITDVSHFNMSWEGPAAALISTSHDIALWANVLFNGQVLPAKQLGEMTSLISMKNGKPQTDSYLMGAGLGLEAGSDPFAKAYGIVYEHKGNTLGYRAQFVYLPCYDTVVALTVNNVSSKVGERADILGDILKAIVKSDEWQQYKKTHKPDQLPEVCKKLWS